MIVTRQSITEKVMDLLTRAENTRFTLSSKIVQYFLKKIEDRNLSEVRQILLDEGLEEILNEMESLGYLSDERFCDIYIRSKFEQGYGVNYIKNKLFQKGVEQTLIKNKISFYENDEKKEMLLEVRVRKFGENLPTSFKEKQKQARFLISRGFEPDKVFELLK